MDPALASVAALGISTVVGALLLVVTFAVIAGFAASRTGGGATASGTFSATIRNDTSQAVYLIECEEDCTTFVAGERLAPQAGSRVGASSDDTPQWYLVVDDGGSRLGCLNLHYDHVIKNLTVRISSVGSCPDGTQTSITTPRRDA
ncbi:hypothetical protein [Sinomonas sp. P47F7]|uniref:hypothetical protein n=1 Tax=Sinomonas sp. P47F7 TaxID=3410987 RepID=UPI003BF4686B